jgi:hypothetical protein
VQAGETRVAGSLMAIECRADAVTLVLRVEDRDMRITAPSFDAVEFITYRDDLAGQVLCEPRTPPDPVLVTWRGDPTESGDVQTSQVVVEFLPRSSEAKSKGR